MTRSKPVDWTGVHDLWLRSQNDIRKDGQHVFQPKETDVTIIDTTLFLDGALRLSRHGAGKGGTILVHEASGRQVSIHPDRERTVPGNIAQLEKLGWRAGPIFDMVEFGERDYQTVLDTE